MTSKLDPCGRLQPHLIQYQVLLCRHTRLLWIGHTLPRISKLTLRAASLLKSRFEGLLLWQLTALERLQVAVAAKKIALADRDLLNLPTIRPFANLRPVKRAHPGGLPILSENPLQQGSCVSSSVSIWGLWSGWKTIPDALQWCLWPLHLQGTLVCISSNHRT